MLLYDALFFHELYLETNLEYGKSADLRGASLSDAVARLDFGGWSICVRRDVTSIGCQTHPNDKWLEWEPSSKEIKRMHSDAQEWWETHGEAVKAVIKCVMNKKSKTAGDGKENENDI